MPSRFNKKVVEDSFVFEGVLDLVQGLSSGENFMNEMVTKRQLPLPHISAEISKNIIANIAVEAFADSSLHTYFTDKDSGKVPLWNTLLRLSKK